MLRLVGAAMVFGVSILLMGSTLPIRLDYRPTLTEPSETVPVASPVVLAPAAGEASPKPTDVREALNNGVLLVVSIPNQHVFVFKKGKLWGQAPVSTGRRGHDTPVGVFPILQKSVAHRSTLYNDAPMPYMQRLTWGGVALHGGNVSRYRASHGCIRLPRAFARSLYSITDYHSTAVLITRRRVTSAATAIALVDGQPVPSAVPHVQLASSDAARLDDLLNDRTRTIQLAATSSPENAEKLWTELVQRQPRLTELAHQITPAQVNSRQVYRLRAYGPGAAAICRWMARSGVDCFGVAS